MRSRGAFSLIELMAVVLIASIAAGAVTLRLHGPLRNSEMDDVAGRIGLFDQLTRQQARREDKALRIAIDLAAGELRRIDKDGELCGSPLKLPEGFSVARLSVGGEDVTYGDCSIEVTAVGLSRSYALTLEGPGDQRRWILLAGLTGQVIEIESEDQLQQLWKTLSQSRPDAG